MLEPSACTSESAWHIQRSAEQSLRKRLLIMSSTLKDLVAKQMIFGIGVVVGLLAMGEGLPVSTSMKALRLLSWVVTVIGVSALANGKGSIFSARFRYHHLDPLLHLRYTADCQTANCHTLVKLQVLHVFITLLIYKVSSSNLERLRIGSQSISLQLIQVA